MTYSQTHYYLTWGGNIGTPAQDIWQCGVRLIDDESAPGNFDLPSVAQVQALYDGALTTFHTNNVNAISSGATMTWAKVAKIGVDGKYIGDAVLYEGAVRAGAASSTIQASPQDALCVTLWSGSHLGEANYGRFYMPWSCPNVSSTTGRILSAATIATNAKTLLDSFSTAASNWHPLDSTEYVVAVMSKVGAGTSKVAKFVRVGDVKDTQRRRRNAIREVYSQQTLA